MKRPVVIAVVMGSAIVAGAGLAYWYKALFQPADAPTVQLAITAALKLHIEAIEVPVWPGSQIGLRDGRERLDGAIVVVGEISAPMLNGLKRRTHLEAMLRRVCLRVEPPCFRVLGLRLDGREMPLAKPIIGGGL